MIGAVFLVFLALLAVGCAREHVSEEIMDTSCSGGATAISGCWITDTCEKDASIANTWRKAIYSFQADARITVKRLVYNDASCVTIVDPTDFESTRVTYSVLENATLSDGVEGWPIAIISESAPNLTLTAYAAIDSHNRMCLSTWIRLKSDGLAFNPVEPTQTIDYSACVTRF